MYGLIGRALPYLVALQDAPRPLGGGSSAPATHPATGGGATGGGASSGLLNILLPMLLMAFVFIFMIGPARKQRKESENLQKSLQKGDKVVTTSSMIGTIVGLDDQFAVVEISEKVRVKFLREAIARKFDANPAPVATGKPAEAKK